MLYRRFCVAATSVATYLPYLALTCGLLYLLNLTTLLPSPVKRVLVEARQQIWRVWPPRHLFVFGGRAPYWPCFGRDLYAQEPVFRATVQECERVLLGLGGESLLANFEDP
jgi:hypothetical protein